MGVRLAGKSAALAEVNQGILVVARDSRFEEQVLGISSASAA
jgi:hypothetical protein